MKIYFEDGPLSNTELMTKTSGITIVFTIDAKDGFSSNFCKLNEALSREFIDRNVPEIIRHEYIVYTNSLVALSNKYCWNDVLGIPELYIRKDSNSKFIRVDHLTDKEIHKVHNLMQMYINGAFHFK